MSHTYDGWPLTPREMTWTLYDADGRVVARHRRAAGRCPGQRTVGRALHRRLSESAACAPYRHLDPSGGGKARPPDAISAAVGLRYVGIYLLLFTDFSYIML